MTQGYYIRKDGKGRIVSASTSPQGAPIYEDKTYDVEREVQHEKGLEDGTKEITTEIVTEQITRAEIVGYEQVEGEEYMEGPMPELYSPMTLDMAIAQRDSLLAASDWIVMRSMERGEEVPQAWRTYRDKLRAIDDKTDLETFKWPKPPAA